MPLQQGSSHATISANVRQLIHEGYEQDHAVAIAMKEAGRSRHAEDAPGEALEAVDPSQLTEHPRVRLFRAGTYDRGTPQEETWTVGDLDSLIRNYWLLQHGPQAVFRPPVVVGHVEPSLNGEHTAVPSYGVLNGAWREGRDLYGPLAELHPKVRHWMDSGVLRGVSIEIYHSPEEANIPPELARGARGPMIRRISLLGGHPPRVKGLGNPPWKAGEGTIGSRPGRCFGELRMDRDHLMQVATQAGFGQQFLDTLDDTQLSGLVADLAGRMLGGGTGHPGDAAGAGGTTPPPPPPPPDGTMPPDTTGTDGNVQPGTGTEPDLDDLTGGNTPDGGTNMPSREEMISELVSMGEDQQALESMDDQSLTELYGQRKGGGGMPAPTTMGEQRTPSRGPVVSMSLDAVRAYAQATARAELARATQPQQQQRISQFCERMVAEGKLTPAQVDPKTGATRKLLEKASRVAKFGEGKSDLDLLMEEIESRPAMRRPGQEQLSSSVAGPLGDGTATLSPERRARILGASPEGRALLREQAKK